jgi:dTDP-4-dehydro-6-deoxy-alpha-D-glucopyranose 2,3-dehydratase
MPVKTIDHLECKEWIVEHDKIRHETNRYFSIVCVKQHAIEHIMIKQDEIGLLGFIVTENGADRQWLVQNKPEPGNINYYQIAPTVQATKSNYERVHGGKKTKYLQHFSESDNLILDMIGSEQGDRFLNKFNRNCKTLTEKKFKPVNKNYFWMDNEELKENLRENYTINTDARSVISTGCWYLLTKNIDAIFINSQLNTTLSESLNNSYHLKSKNLINNIGTLLEKGKNIHNNSYELIPLKEMKQHSIVESGIVNRENIPIISFFDIQFQEREVKRWKQPLLVRSTMEYCILVFHIFNNTAMFYLKAYPELGFKNHLELGPSFQTGNGIQKNDGNDITKILNSINILTEIEQTDEGGRFYQNSCTYILGQWKNSPDDLSTDLGIWLSAGDLEILSLKKGLLTNELRTMLSLLLSFA